jgi:hypothetical protein
MRETPAVSAPAYEHQLQAKTTMFGFQEADTLADARFAFRFFGARVIA